MSEERTHMTMEEMVLRLREFLGGMALQFGDLKMRVIELEKKVGVDRPDHFEDLEEARAKMMEVAEGLMWSKLESDFKYGLMKKDASDEGTQ